MRKPDKITKGLLYRFHTQIESWYRNAMVEQLFHQVDIAEFYKHYAIRIKTIEEEVEKMQQKYFVYEDGKPKMIITGETQTMIPLEGKTHEDFQVALNHYMNQDIVESGIVTLSAVN